LQKVREKDQLAKTHLLDVKQFFDRQYHLTMLRFWHMQEYFPQQPAEPVRVMEAKKAINPEALKRWTEIWNSIETETTRDLQGVVKNIEADALLKGADQLRSQFGFDAKRTFSLSNPRAVRFFQQTGGSVDYIKGIQQTTADSLKRVITTGLDEGWSYNDTAKEIQKLFDGPISTDRARLIATHESAQAYEAGNRAFADTIRDQGIEMEKSWCDSGDEKVCDECLRNVADGWIPIDEPHSSGDQYPPLHPGDRCYEQYRQAKA
jgi:hypothetical protein